MLGHMVLAGINQCLRDVGMLNNACHCVVQFFISPLISEDGVEREVNAVDSECVWQ